VTFVGPSSQALVLGGHKYEVSINSFTFRDFPKSDVTGFSALLDVPVSVRVSEMAQAPLPDAPGARALDPGAGGGGAGGAGPAPVAAA